MSVICRSSTSGRGMSPSSAEEGIVLHLESQHREHHSIVGPGWIGEQHRIAGIGQGLEGSEQRCDAARA